MLGMMKAYLSNYIFEMNALPLDDHENDTGQETCETQPRTSHRGFDQSVSPCSLILRIIGIYILTIPITIISWMFFAMRVMKLLVDFRISQNWTACDTNCIKFWTKSISITVSVAVKFVIVFKSCQNFFSSSLVRIRIQFVLNVFTANKKKTKNGTALVLFWLLC